MSCRRFVSRARRESLLEDVIRYLVLLLVEEQEAIAMLISGIKAEHRTGLLPKTGADAAASQPKVDQGGQREGEATL